MEVVINGVFGLVMVAYGKQMIVVDLVVVIIYKRNIWENKTGGMVSFVDVQAFMDK